MTITLIVIFTMSPFHQHSPRATVTCATPSRAISTEPRLCEEEDTNLISQNGLGVKRQKTLLIDRISFPWILLWSLIFKMTIPSTQRTNQATMTLLSLPISVEWIAVILLCMLGSTGLRASLVLFPIAILVLLFLAAGSKIPDMLASITTVANAKGISIFEIIFDREGSVNSVMYNRLSTWIRSVILFYAVSIPCCVTALPVPKAVPNFVPDASSSNWVLFLIVLIFVLILLWFGLHGYYDFGPSNQGEFAIAMGSPDTNAENASCRNR